MTVIDLKPVIAGTINAPALVLETSISFWGGIDYESGLIIDQSHPQVGKAIGGTCLIVPMVRGSGGTPGNIADMLRRGCGPAGIVIGHADINVMAGIKVAQRLYGSDCPMFVADGKQLALFKTAKPVSIEEDGRCFQG